MIINVGPSFCRVDGTRDELYWLKALLTVDVPGAQYTAIYRRQQWDGKKRFFSLVSKVFPVGLLDYVLKNKGTKIIVVEDTRVYKHIDNIPSILNTIELRDYQIEAIQSCLSKRNCLVEAATNAGKTAIFSGIIKKLYPLPTLVLTHRSELLVQTRDFIKRYTGIECGLITSVDVLIKPITVAMISTLANRIGVDQEITDFYESVQCVIADECHHSKAKTFASVLSASKAVYRFGFSGTIPPEGTLEGMEVRQFIGSVGFSISNERLIDLKVSAKPHILLFEIDVRDKVRGIHALAKAELEAVNELYSTRELLRKTYDLVIKRAIVNNIERNMKTVEVINKEKSKSVLIVVDYLEHGMVIEELLRDNNIICSFISGSSEHRVKALQEFKEGSLKVLIATNIVDEGLDISQIGVLVLLAGKKSRRQLLQRIGRSLRRKSDSDVVHIYDFCDFGNKYLEKHTKERISIYKAEKFDMQFV